MCVCEREIRERRRRRKVEKERDVVGVNRYILCFVLQTYFNRH